MAITDIILQYPQILVRQTSGSIGSLGISVDVDIYSWGIVEKVYETSDRTTVGYSILFKTPEAPLFTVSGVKYYIISEESDLSFTENPPP